MLKNLAHHLMIVASLSLPFQTVAWAKKDDKPKTEKVKKKKNKAPQGEAPAEGVVTGTEIADPAKLSETVDPCTLALVPQANPERWTALNERDQFAALLLMIGSSFTPRFVGKYLFEKGEFSLGIELEGRRTLDLNYVLDSRFGDGILILTAINLVDAFGHVNTLLAKPIDPLTGQLRPIKTNNMISQAEYDELVFPITIQGKLLERLMKSKQWLENVNSDEIREKAASDVIRLRGLGHMRWLKSFLFRDLLKYTFRFAVFAGILISLGVVEVNSGKGSMTRAIYEMFTGDQVTSAVMEVAPQDRANLAITEMGPSLTIDAAEKQWLTTALRGDPELASAETKIAELDFRMIASDVTGRNWLYFPKDGSIYLTTADTKFSNKKDQTKFGNLIAIPRAEMPLTHATVTALFQESLSPVTMSAPATTGADSTTLAPVTSF